MDHTMSVEKPRIKIEKWWLWKYEDDYFINGEVKEHPRLGPSGMHETIRSSRVLFFIRSESIVETMNSIYELGEPHSGFTIPESFDKR